MTGKKMNAVVAMVLALVVLMQFAIPMSANAATDINQLQKKRSELAKRESALKDKIKDSKNKIEAQEIYKGALDEQISVVQEQVNTLNEQIGLLDAEIQEKSTEISGHEQSIHLNQEQLKERLRALYIAGETSDLAILLGASDVEDMFNKADIMRRVADHDRNLIDELKQTKSEVEEQLTTIQNDRTMVADARKELSKKQSELTSLINESNNLIKNLQDTEKAAQEEQKKVSNEMQKADQEIDAWHDEYERKRKEKEKNNSDDNGDNNNNNNAAKNPYVIGDFAWPVPGYYKISSPFGPRWGRMHKGIDIAGGGIHGKSIVAAADGTVVRVSYDTGGYGNYFVIDHGSGYTTLYGHCSSVSVSNGQSVKKGQVVGKVGNTGRSTGPHLHFEIRVGGVAKNPLGWYK